jgi:hypothetical protein
MSVLANENAPRKVGLQLVRFLASSWPFDVELHPPIIQISSHSSGGTSVDVFLGINFPL